MIVTEFYESGRGIHIYTGVSIMKRMPGGHKMDRLNAVKQCRHVHLQLSFWP